MKKINKDFVLSDSSVNSYGFRLLTSGYQIDEFIKNPIGYFMHGTDEYNREQGVLTKWENLRIENDKIIATPCINVTHPRGNRTIDEIESGFLNAASMGSIVVLESSDSPNLMLPGQTGLTITKWFNRECSLVDVPGNYNALKLYNVDGFALNLSAFVKVNKLSASLSDKILNTDELLKSALIEKNITPEVQKILKQQYQNDPISLNVVLSEFRKTRISYLMSLSWKELDRIDLANELKTKFLEGYKQKFFVQFGKEYSDGNLSKPVTNLEIDRLFELANKDNVITTSQEDFIRKSYEDDLPKMKNIILSFMNGRIEKLMNMSYDELDRSGLAEELKNSYFDGYKEKFKSKFGVEYKNKK